jgi:hypothetical protein
MARRRSLYWFADEGNRTSDIQQAGRAVTANATPRLPKRLGNLDSTLY